jgi:4-amino-4-deoxy-L-arabinose transferase-like glycosyltransferase
LRVPVAILKISRRRLFYPLLAVALFAIAALRVSSTYTTFSGTDDEPWHIASGMQWLDQGKFTYETEHPPLAPILMASVPYLRGLRSHSLADANAEGNAILTTRGRYEDNLYLARLGNLPFLALASLVIFAWAARWMTQAAGFWALLLFLCLPPVLGHAGLATLDIACAATLITALYCLMRWLERPSRFQSVALGIALSFAVLSKFSNLIFIPLCAVVAVAVRSLLASKMPHAERSERARGAAIAVSIMLFTIWAAYGFSLTPLAMDPGVYQTIDKGLAPGSVIRALAVRLATLPFPFTQMVTELEWLFRHSVDGHDSFLLGHYGMTGWWYFFPVVIFFKTPLAFLALAIPGFFFLTWKFESKPWQLIATALFPCALLTFCMMSRIDLGVRHILAIYPFLALMAGAVVARICTARAPVLLAAAAVGLVVSVAVSSVLAHPDYLAYFNRAAGEHPERILAESDLDWGQDLQRLGSRLKVLGIKEVSLCYFGSAPLEAAGLPVYRAVSPTQKTTGYVAISARYLNLGYARDGSYGWLRNYTPLERVGRSIFLYRIDR